MNKLYKIQSPDRIVNQIQDAYIKTLNPVLDNPLLDYNLLKSISLNTGTNIIPHGLNRPLIGWYFTRIRAGATIYDTQDSNTTPAANLQLTASAPVTVDIFVF